MASIFDSNQVPDLQKYLRDRGVTVAGYNNHSLKTLAEAVNKLQLSDDPDLCKNDSIETKLSEIGLSKNCNPLTVSGYTKDFTDIPDFWLIDIFNYLIFKNADYDRKNSKLSSPLNDRHVQQLEFNHLSKDDNACLFHAKVKPTQRDSTYLKKECYDLWFALDKSDGYVITGHCECKGGSQFCIINPI
ncbi:hypothetical protein KUTeg_018319 [Tegillarca granosa]|uniref:Uncharacterized protein n=1 Tax=Tegillarca granosa TaxID=220873 RepID=A0ABQ9ELJ7_TEGGR|nr:hypothetical protein KUTeg_018319 [Tegillarca granosa]